MMANNITNNDSAWTTTILVQNVHCASCVSYIQRVLTGASNIAVHRVETNILSHEVTVHHDRLISASSLCQRLSEAAFEVYSATTFDQHGAKVQEIGAEGSGDGWLEAATEFWRPSHRASSSGQHLQQSRKSTHLANCDACRKDSIHERTEGLSTTMLVNSRTAEVIASRSGSNDTFNGEKSSSLSHSRDPSTRLEASSAQEPSANISYEAVLSIGGMTCASCTSAIDHGLAELSCIKSVNVVLMTNSAHVVFTGQENLQSIVDAVEDLGYDCAVERSSPAESKDKPIANEGKQRSVMLKIDGMFCKHCPPRVVDTIKSKYGNGIALDQIPTLKEPFMRISYTPRPPDFTIRDITATIESLDSSFSATIYTPPSIEQRSQAMQKHEQHRLLIRLLLSFVIAIPTLLIGVVWMSLVPASNSVRHFFEQPVWAGNVVRADWALFILATPVFFLAGDVFHLRAIKEIRALWRKGSKVPLFQRFYRFGSMNLLISAGTSVAYFASIAVLGLDATDNSRPSTQSSTYFDSVVFLTFFILIGRYLEAFSKAKTGNAVAMLGDLRPQEATLVVSSGEPLSPDEVSKEITEMKDETAPRRDVKRVHANLLEVGDTVIISHGSSPPADGVIAAGSTQFNESSLTGEARAVPKQQGDTVFAGSVNVGDPVSISVTDAGGSSMLDQIVAVVREGQTKRAPVERVVDIVTGYFVPVITALAITTFVIWLSLGYSGALSKRYLDSQQGGWAFWSLEFAIAVFVVACPCGLGLAAPTALFVGSGLAANHGILVRGGGEAFQEASDIDGVVFDKTGTLTEGGDLQVTDHEVILPEEESQIAWCVTKSLEETSSHPMARAILEFAAKQSILQAQTTTITEKPGLGLQGTFIIQSPSSTEPVAYEAALGSEALISTLVPPPEHLTYFTKTTLSTWKSGSKSVALLALRKLPDGNPTSDLPAWELAAMFAISDPIRPSAIPTITTLQDRGVPVYMLTGDNPTTASAVASTLSIPQDHVFAGVLPTEKADKIQWLKDNAPRRSSSTSWLRQKLSGKSTGEEGKQKAIIAFVGDGINDAPALTTASVSISLSTASDIAMHSSSFILLGANSLDSIITLFALSERVFRRVKFNFGWAVVYNVILVPIAAGCLFRVKEGGWRLGPVWGSAAMALSSLCVVGSSLALRWEGDWGGERIRRALGKR